MITMYYDDTCTLCTSNANALHTKNPDKIAIVPVDNAIEILAKAGISRVEAMTYVVVQDQDGTMHKGMDAVRLLDSTAGRTYAPLLYLPVIKQLGDFAYPFIARNRYYFPKWAIKLLYGKVANVSQNTDCDNGVCHIPPHKR